MSESQLEINRWRRYGKDRLYVTREDGSKVGWWNLHTGESHPDSESDLAVLISAAQEWMSTAGVDALEVITTAEHAAVAPAGLSPAERPWLDLAHNVPGAEARAQAVAAKEAAPVRTLLARALRVHTDERAWRLGADGEEKVAAQFDKVLKKDPRWQFIHAIPVGTRGSDIDHLIIGPGGVFTANAKNHPNGKVWVGGDTLMVNGQRQPYIRNARHEAARAAKLLSQVCGWSVPVEGVIVLVNAIEWTIKTPPKDVHVVPRRQIARWLLRRGDVLDAERQAEIFDAARRSTTWH
jgi:hypothetical protein